MLGLACELIARPSVSPNDAGCQEVLLARLRALGFHIERLRFNRTDNLWARRGGERPLLVFAGHTDVVPPGSLDQWLTPPFEPAVRSGVLYGRGAADMKGSLAAMITACEAFVHDHPDHSGSLGFLVTSDEEGDAADGTVRVMETLEARQEKIDFCVVGEPSSAHRLGDTIRIGRRGSLTGRLRVRGIQGHVAYPDAARNPIHDFAAAAAQLCREVWDAGDESFPPTSFQLSNVHAGSGASNVVPGRLEASFNFRYSPSVTETALRQRVQAILDHHGVDYELTWRAQGAPFVTSSGALREATLAAVEDVTGLRAALSTAGGTSDGRFIAPTGAQVVEVGPVNATIHKVNECVRVADLKQLVRIYRGIMERVLGPRTPRPSRRPPSTRATT